MSELYESNEAAWQLLGRGKVRDIYEYGPNEMLIVTSDRSQRVRRDPADADPRQGHRAHADQQLLVRADRRHHRPTTWSDPEPFSTDRRARAPERHGPWWCAWPRRCPSRPSCAATSPARAGRSTRRAARSAASRCPPGLVEAAGCPSPSSRRRPRPPSASTTRTSPSTRTGSCWARSWRPRCGTRRWPCTRSAPAYARERGIIIADTKFEFGLLDGELILIDEVLTPDSSRFWPLDGYDPGQGPAELRQAVRARLPGDARLGQDGARPGAARRRWWTRPPRSTARRGAA